MAPPPYAERRPARSLFLDLRGLRLHVRQWGEPALATPARPPLVLLHGWMDVGASFQFMVDALAEDRLAYALDWRGFGLSSCAPGGYWFPDYLGDLEAVLDALAPDGPVDLLGHSMGGNVAMLYAGVRPERIRRLVNLEGFGQPDAPPSLAPRRYAQWLDELREPRRLRSYESLAAAAERLATHWAARRDDGRWHILADPAHKRVNPVLYRKAEVLECWKRIAAPVLWVEGDETDVAKWWGGRYSREEFLERLAAVPDVTRETLSPSGHMVHLDQPEALAATVERFLAG
jgi:pimeloyl-ACP methyl ester carboxylesterase